MASAASRQQGSHNLTEDILNSAFDSIIVLEPNGAIRHINPATLQILGGKESDFVGYPVNSIVAEIQDHEEDLFEYVSLERLITRGLIKNHRLNFLGSGDRRIPVLFSASLIRDQRDGSVAGVLCIAKDLTEMMQAEALLEDERRAAEERLTRLKDFAESVIHHMSDLLVVADDENRVIRFNNNFARILEYDATALEGRPLQSFFESVSLFDSLRHRLESGGLESVGEEAYFVTRLGEKIPVDLTLTVLIGPQGMREGVILTARDLREKKVLQELRLKQQQLVQQAKLASLGELSGGIAHELNNPLSVIAGYTELVLEDLEKNVPVDVRMRDYIQKIRVAADKMAGIIRHVREFSRQADRKIKCFDLHDLVNKALSLTRQQLIANDIDLQVDFMEGPAWVIGDATQLEQVFLGILVNARQAIQEAQVKGRVTVSSLIEDGWVEIAIEDNGVGIREEHLSRVFDPFFTTKEVGKGTGLGLSIAHGILTEHEGEVQCSSRFGSGSRFTIILPFTAKGAGE